MPVFDTVLNLADDFLKLMGGRMLGHTFAGMSPLHSVETRGSFACADGSLMSMIAIGGVNTVIGGPEYESVVTKLHDVLSPYFVDAGHILQWVHYDDPELIHHELDEMMAPYEAAAKRHEMDLGAVFRERKSKLGQYCSTEWTYWTVWTFPAVLSPQEKRRAVAERARLKAGQKGQSVPYQSFHAQDSTMVVEGLRNRHFSLVNKIVQELNTARRGGVGYYAAVIGCDPGAHLLKKTFAAHLAPTHFKLWEPNKLPPVRVLREPIDDRGVLWPLVSEQLFGVTGEDLGDLVRVGNKYYGAVTIQLGPMERQSFDSLLVRAKAAMQRMPWRVTCTLSGAGLGPLIWRNVAARMFGFSSANAPIADAFNHLERLVKDGVPVASMRYVFSTWGDSEEQARDRMAALSRVVQGWGQCQVSDYSGDTPFAVLSSVGGATYDNPANWSAFELSECVKGFPMRPRSPWSTGGMLFRTSDGRLMPMQPGQAVQQVAVELVVAPMGYGKSVLLNARHLAHILSPRAEKIPLLAVIDVGPSSLGIITTVRNSLPEHLKHLAVYAKLRNERTALDCRINPFDLHLGFRFPLARDRDSLINIVALLATPADSKPADELYELVARLIDYAYLRTAESYPSLYEEERDRLVDDLIRKGVIELPVRATWYEVTDSLAAKGLIYEAIRAQRFAVPTIGDMLGALKSKQITDLYSSREDLISQCYRMISSAMQDMPILSSPTTFDVGSARVISIDLDDVAKGIGAAGLKQAGACYLLAMSVATKRFSLRDDDIHASVCPVMYHDYHRHEIRDNMSAPMQLSFDEAHRTVRLPPVKRQVELECREGRKRGINIMLASQSIDDIPEVIAKELSNGIYILGGSHDAAKNYAEIFGLDETQKQVIERYANGPKSEGSTMLVIHNTSEGKSSHMVTLTLGPVELWAYSTTPEDTRLRAAVGKLMGGAEALLALAMVFPGGSARALVEERELAAGDDKFGRHEPVVDIIGREVADMYRRHRMHA